MRTTFHPLATKDVEDILAQYYDVSERVGDGFYAELESVLASLESRPHRGHLFAPIDEDGPERRRLNSKRYPFNIIYEPREFENRILTVRHDRRHPDHGLDRTWPS